MMTVTQARKYQHFLDLNASLMAGRYIADRRIQVKMPGLVVDELDRLFPDKDRSFVLTQLVIQAVLQYLRFSDREILQEQIASEQEVLDDAVNYLEQRDAGII